MATDKRLDQVPNLTDFDYALIVKGEQVSKISKEDLASVVAGQMSFVKFSTSPKSNNANEIYTPLIYLNMNVMSNVPTQYGTLFCFGSETHAIQFYIPAESTNMLYFRQKTSSSWTAWSKIF